MLDDKILTAIKTELISDERMKLIARMMQKHFEPRMRKLTAERAKESIRERLTTVEGEL